MHWTTYDAISIKWCWYLCTWHHITKNDGHLLLIILTWHVEWYHWWHCWHDISLTLVSIALHDWKIMLCCISVILTKEMLYHWWCLWDHMTKNFMLHLVLIILSYEMECCIMWHQYQHDGITGPKMFGTHRFNHLDLMNTKVLLNAICITWCWCQFQQCQMTKNSCCISFQTSWTIKEAVLLMMQSLPCDASVGITWPESHVWACFNHFDLANKMVSLTVLSVSCDAVTGANSITWPTVGSQLVSIALI